MAKFNPGYQKTNVHEKGYSFHSSDKGKETWDGISRYWWPDLELWKYIDKQKLNPGFPGNIDRKKIEPEKRQFYKREYWNKINGDKIPDQKLAEALYDIAVNMHPHTAGEFLQRTLNRLNRRQRDYKDIVVDGAIGKNTLKAIRSFIKKRGKKRGYKNIMYWINIQKGTRWWNLSGRKESQEDFMYGWGNRGIENFREFINE